MKKGPRRKQEKGESILIAAACVQSEGSANGSDADFDQSKKSADGVDADLQLIVVLHYVCQSWNGGTGLNLLLEVLNMIIEIVPTLLISLLTHQNPVQGHPYFQFFEKLCGYSRRGYGIFRSVDWSKCCCQLAIAFFRKRLQRKAISSLFIITGQCLDQVM